MSSSRWCCWFLNWPFKNVEGVLVSVAKRFRAAEVTLVPVSSGDRQQSSPAEGHWRGMVEDKDVWGTSWFSSTLQQPLLGDSSKRQGRKGSAHLCRSTNISCASRGIPAWQWAQLTQGGGSCPAALHCFARNRVMNTVGNYSWEFLRFSRTDIRYIERLCSWVSNGEVSGSAAKKKVSLVHNRPHYMELFPHGFYKELSSPWKFPFWKC